jgi:hypothetical protein
MSMLLLDIFDRRRARDTLASRGSRAETHCHIVTTFEAGAKSWHFRVVVQFKYVCTVINPRLSSHRPRSEVCMLR